MAGARNRVEGQEAFVLRLHPFRETSLIAEVFSRAHGRLALVARGARRPHSAVRGLLMEFRRIELSWFGAGEVKTLAKAEWLGAAAPLAGRGLLFGYYLNELLLRLTPREVPHPELFEHYAQALEELAGGACAESALRRFELRMLRSLGWGLTLDREAPGGEPVRPQRQYAFVIERGVVPVSGADRDAVAISGEALLAMAREDFGAARTRAEGKVLMRQVLGHYLGGRPLNTRRVFVELQEL
ncbi:MAG: DNA repair protein RecO [Rhodocyclaceae bacterium]